MSQKVDRFSVRTIPRTISPLLSFNLIMSKIKRRKDTVSNFIGADDETSRIKIYGEDELEMRIKALLRVMRILSFYQVQEVGLHYRDLADEDLNMIGLKLAGHSIQLKKLSLSFGICDAISDGGVQFLISQISQNLKQLQELSLNFGGGYECTRYGSIGQVTDKGIEIIGSEIARNLTKLHSLNLAFGFCDEITDNSVQRLAFEVTRNLTQLHHLGIKFKECDRVSDQGPAIIAKAIGNSLFRLTSLSVAFEGCRGISNAGLASLGVIARNLTQLNRLNLSFTQCHKITHEGVKPLILDIVKHLQHLKDLNLDFDYCQVTNQEMDALRVLIKENLPQLQHLTLLPYIPDENENENAIQMAPPSETSIVAKIKSKLIFCLKRLGIGKSSE